MAWVIYIYHVHIQIHSLYSIPNMCFPLASGQCNLHFPRVIGIFLRKKAILLRLVSYKNSCYVQSLPCDLSHLKSRKISELKIGNNHGMYSQMFWTNHLRFTIYGPARKMPLLSAFTSNLRFCLLKKITKHIPWVWPLPVTVGNEGL